MAITPTTIKNLADQDLPFPVRNLSVSADGNIIAEATNTLRFHYLLDKQRWDCLVVMQPDLGAILTVSRTVGGMPYSAEGPELRQAMKEILAAFAAAPLVTVEIDAKRQLVLSATRSIFAPVDDTAVLSTAIEATMTLCPWARLAERYTRGHRQAA